MNLRFSRLLILLTAVSTSACYSYVPVATAPAPGTEVALLVSDRGRVELGERVGPEMDQLRGTLVSSSESAVTLRMREAVSLRRVSTTWTGESLTVSPSLLAGVRVKQLDRGRSLLMAGGVTAAVIAFIITRQVIVDDQKIETDPSKPPTDPGSQSIRIPLTFLFRSH
ncbi:MAG: hypothetical protein IBJ03_00500 [Gemmatimonadaceae bacterium]|nr:hypothetical protein [Gemmatimonadaceae bacterium]